MSNYFLKDIIEAQLIYNFALIYNFVLISSVQQNTQLYM